MGVSLLAVPAIEPVSLDELKDMLRITGDEEDTGIVATTVAARVTVERMAGRYLISQSWRAHFDAVPEDLTLGLPFSPVQAIVQVRVLKADGGATVVPAADWVADLSSDPVRIRFLQAPPRPGVPIDGVQVDAVVGYGTAAAHVPADLRQAVKLLAARWYETRAEGAAAADMPEAVVRLTEAHRPRRLIA